MNCVVSVFADSVIVSPSSAIMRPAPTAILLKVNRPVDGSTLDNTALPLPIFVPV